MPIGLIVSGERPLDRVPAEPALNVNVLGYIAIIVIVDEWMMNRRVVKNDGGDYKDKAKNEWSIPCSTEQACPRLRRSSLPGFCMNMLGFQASRSHSSPIFDEYIRLAVCCAGSASYQGTTLSRAE